MLCRTICHGAPWIVPFCQPFVPTTTGTTGCPAPRCCQVGCPARGQMSLRSGVQQDCGLWGTQWPQHPKAICSDLISSLIASCTGCWKCLKVQVQKGKWCIMFGFSPSVVQSKQRTCCAWKPEFLETKAYLNCVSVTWLFFTLNFTAISHSQGVQRGIEDMQTPLGIFNLKYLSAWFCFSPSRYLSSVRNLRETSAEFLGCSFSDMWRKTHDVGNVLLCSFSFISLFSVLNWYYRQSHIQHLSLVGLPTAYFDNVGKPAVDAQQHIALFLLPVFITGQFPSTPLFILFNYNFPASQKSLFLPELGSLFTANSVWRKYCGQDF